MAYGQKIKLEYYDINNALTEIYISEKDYTGSVVTRDAQANPLEISWGDQSGPELPVIYGSSAVVRFYADTDFEFLELYSADAKKYKVEVYKDSVLYWSGYSDPETWEEPLIAAPYPVELTAIDGLGILKTEDFVDGSGNVYTGSKSWFDIIKICIDKIELGLNLNTAIDFRSNLHALTDDVLKTTEVDVLVFEGESCYSVLKSILTECRIFQRNGEWWIISNTNFARDHYLFGFDLETSAPIYAPGFAFKYKKYDAAGTLLSSGTQYTTSTDYWFHGVPGLGISPALKHAVINQDYGFRGNIFQNGDFQDGVTGWTSVGVTPEVRTLNDKGEKFVYLLGKQKPFSTDDLTNGIKQSIVVTASDTNIKLMFKYALMGIEGVEAYMYWSLRLDGDAGTDYFAERTEGDTPETTFYEWKTSGGLQNQPVKYQYEYKYNNVSKVSAWPADKITSKFTSFEQFINGGIPDSGTITLYLFVPFSDNVQIGGSAWADVNIQLYQSDNIVLPTGRSLKTTNNASNNYVPEELDVKFGDSPIAENATAVYAGILTVAAGITETWGVDYETGAYTYGELIGHMLASRLRRPLQTYSASIADFIPGLFVLIQDALNSGKRFLENGLTYSDKMQTCTGQWVETLDTVISTGTISENVEHDASKGLTSTASSAPQSGLNFDEKVALADVSTGEKTTEAGFLDSSDFEETEVNGISVFTIVPRYRSNSQSLTAGSNRVDFLHEFPAGTSYRIDWKTMAGDYLVGSKLTGTPDHTGFYIYVEKACTLDYTATPYY